MNESYRRRGFLLVALLIPLIVILAGVIFFAFRYGKNKPSASALPTPTQTLTADTHNDVDAALVTKNRTAHFTRTYPTAIKGVYEPGNPFFADMIAGSDEGIGPLGINTVSIYVDHQYQDGDLVLLSENPGEGSTNEQYIAQIIRAKEKGFAVLLAVAFWGSEDAPFAHPQEKVLTHMRKVALAWATIAEQYQVEYFVPASEFDWQLYREYTKHQTSEQDAIVQVYNTFHAEILPEIKKIFTGKTVAQYALPTPNTNVPGYDYVAPDMSPSGRNLEDWRTYFPQLLEYAATAAKNSGSQWFIGEFWVPHHDRQAGSGTAGKLLTTVDGQSYDELQDEFYAAAFEEYEKFAGELKPQGLMFTQYAIPYASIKGRPTEAVIKDFFGKI